MYYNKERGEFTIKKKTNKSFVSEVFNLVGDEYTFLDEYKGSKVKLKVLHSKCNKTYYVTPNNFCTGYRCPYCFGTPKKTQREFEHEVEVLTQGEYSVIGKYQRVSTKILMKHNICGSEYMITPGHFLAGVKCPICAGFVQSTEHYKQKLLEAHITYLEPIEDYISNGVKINHKCLICGNIWKAKPNAIFNGHGCPLCALQKSQSFGERGIESYLQQKSIPYEYPKKFDDLSDTKKLHYDFYIPTLRTLIEYQGRQHYGPVSIWGGDLGYKKQQKHDNMKKQYAKEHNYTLLEIPYTYNTTDKIYKFLDNKFKCKSENP